MHTVKHILAGQQYISNKQAQNIADNFHVKTCLSVY